jgi:diguanylate cyclase (GGDEF)-like protein/PAS domain S-box-containing protein
MNTSAPAGDQHSTSADAEWFRVLFNASSDPARVTQAHLRLASSILESTSEGILVTDEHGVIVSVNPAFTHITGYRAEEAIGRKPSLLKSDHHGQSFYEELWNTLLTEGRWRGEIWNRHKNGTAYPILQTINRIPAHDGMPTCYASVFHDITALHRANERFQYLAFHDALTGLPNRALFHDRLLHAIERSRRDGQQLVVIFIDLDGFKEVNDACGHDVGDLLLREIAQRIRNRVRRATDTVARLGGDEFLVLMEDLKGPNHCEELAAELIADISRPMKLRDHVVSVGASVGLARYPEDSTDTIELMKHADIAMYAAKSDGKNRHRRFNPAMLKR